MSWRRFCALYRGLSPSSQVCLNYDRIARREDAATPEGGRGAWQALTALSRPQGR